MSWVRTVVVGRRPGWTLVRIAIVIVATVILLKFVVSVRRVKSTSMLPTLPEESVHFFNRLAYPGSRRPQRGDIVAIRTSGETILYVKRIVGLPGEKIQIRQGTVYIDGNPLEEPYVRYTRRRPPFWNFPEHPPIPRVLGTDEYLVIGDNRSMPQELQDFGIVHGERIVGKLVW